MSSSHRGFKERVLPGETSKTLLEEHEERYRFAGKLVRGHVTLDAACGSGYGLTILANSGATSVIGLDASTTAVLLAKKAPTSSRIAIIRGDVMRLPIKSGKIDVVVSLETIEHVSSPETCMREIHRVLREEGCAVVSTPNKTIVSPHSENPANPFHVREFTAVEFQSLLNQLFPLVTLYGQTLRGNRRDLDLLFSISNVLHRLGFHPFLEALRRLLEDRLTRPKPSRINQIRFLLQCPVQVKRLLPNLDAAPRYLTALCEKTGQRS